MEAQDRIHELDVEVKRLKRGIRQAVLEELEEWREEAEREHNARIIANRETQDQRDAAATTDSGDSSPEHPSSDLAVAYRVMEEEELAKRVEAVETPRASMPRSRKRAEVTPRASMPRSGKKRRVAT